MYSLPPSSPPPSFADDPNRQFIAFSPDLLVLTRPDGRCLQVSPASLDLLGRPAATMIGTDVRDLVLDADRHILGDLLADLGKVTSFATATFRACCAHGTWIWVEAHARRLPAGAGIVLVLRDISARKEEEAVLIEANDLLRRRATLDPVTCLPNRGHFFAALERELRRAQREETPLSLLAVGVDEMRLFNDCYNRDAGDLALREVGMAVEAALSRPCDLAGRLKGAMLGVVLPGTALAGAAAVADRLRQAVTALKLEHAGVPSGRMTATVGIACAESRSKAAALIGEAVYEVEVTRAASMPTGIAS